MRKVIFYIRTFFVSVFVLLMTSFSIVYLLALSEDKSKEDFILKTIDFKISDFLLVISQNLSVFIFFTLIMLSLFILIYVKRKPKADKISNRILYFGIAETWLSVVVIFFYIVRGMQGLRFNILFASILTIATFFFIVDYFSLSQNKFVLRKKIYVFILVFASFFIHWLKSNDVYYTVFDLIVQSLSFNFLILLVYGFYLLIDTILSSTEKIFAKFIYIFLSIFIYSLALVLLIVLIYVVYYVIVSLFSGFHFRGMFHNPSLIYLSALFKDSFNKIFTVYSYSDYLNPFLTILSIVFLIKDKEEEETMLEKAENIDEDKELQKIKLSEADKNKEKVRKHRLIAEWIMVIIGIWALHLFFVR